ncbi:acyl carrier protein [Lysinibacillus sp. OTC-L20]|uniref:acyl carrier protein n=1 Tax=Lysinibacillus sp. OTC-L20 TaxID=3342791 RepID=UPI0035B7D72F
MSNLIMYNRIFIECFEIKETDLNDSLIYNSIETWDSIGHMAMIAELEDAFDIMIDTEDVIDFNSYEKGKSILAKYDIEI